MKPAKMPEKYGGILAVAFVVFSSTFFLIGLYQGVGVGHSDYAEIAAEIHHENTARRIRDTCAAAQGAALNDCIENAVNTSGEYQRAERGLAAQNSMTVYTKWLLIITSFGTGITVVGVWFVKRTLEETAAAVSAANAANKIMRDEQRPWIDFTASLIDFLITDDWKIRGSAKITITNIGKSPARNAVIDITAYSGIRNIEEARGLHTMGDDYSTIFPNKAITSTTQFGSDINQATTKDGQEHVAGTTIILRICLRYSADKVSVGEFHTIQEFEVRNGGQFAFFPNEAFHNKDCAGGLGDLKLIPKDSKTDIN